MSKYYVYEWIRLDTNEPFYVGKGHGNRWKHTNGRNSYFTNIINKVPCVVNILHDNLDEETAFGLEIWYIREYRDIIGYNMCNINDGGEGQTLCGELNPMYGAKGLCGKDNPSSRAIICLNTNKVFDTVQEGADFYNCSNSGLVQCCKGNRSYNGTLNGEPLVWLYYKDYLSMTNNEIKEKLNYSKNDNRKTSVICITTGKVFNGVRDGARFYNIDGSSIVKCCKGKFNSCGKLEDGTPLVWMYYEDYLKNKGE